MNVFFGLASYGLSGYEWYLLGGLSILINEHMKNIANENKSALGGTLASRGDKNLSPLRLP